MILQIRDYLELGFSLCPVMPRTKIPYTGVIKKMGLKSWLDCRDYKPTEKDILLWESLKVNIGLMLKDNLVCFDFDTQESFERFYADNYYYVSNTAIQSTSRGKHVLFRLKELTKPNFFLSDCEIKINGKFMVSPSIHPSGFVYSWDTPITNILEVSDFDCFGLSKYSQQKIGQGSLSLGKISEMTMFLAPYLADDYTSWLTIALALKYSFGEEGYQVWDLFSQASKKYNAKKNRAFWNKLAPKNITAGTIVYLYKKYRGQG